MFFQPDWFNKSVPLEVYLKQTESMLRQLHMPQIFSIHIEILVCLPVGGSAAMQTGGGGGGFNMYSR